MNKIISFKTFRRHCASRGLVYYASKCRMANYSICGMIEMNKCTESNCPIWKRLKGVKNENRRSS